MAPAGTRRYPRCSPVWLVRIRSFLAGAAEGRTRLRMPDQSLAILAMLLERPDVTVEGPALRTCGRRSQTRAAEYGLIDRPDYDRCSEH